mmetsp:Transcript_44347/g.102423  ORF Transcript_44347/g.102423 Transcript_44347/m.102423 type:complete len:171 (-) Transcript_44347:154-666(-)|eukprot:CAMPEP_0171105118 /NCGR_PEP_ID=MMETSP0766_2-20121228/62011_1 /TAXON_ID=439317 /ORGANISM="Gambierdiscus australes, Strain CAWD 149" /LENGTH=170 /DNA_ID=CAMNT_0011565885 /DNA_START=44 /DNA_END=556 /DNA_ORIENTATION=-
MATWPPKEDALDEFIERNMSPKGRGRGEGLWLNKEEALFWYATELVVRAAGGKEWGARYILDPKKWELVPFMNDEVKGAVKTIADTLAAQPLDGEFSYRENLCLKGFANVVDDIMTQNPGDKGLIEDCLRIVVEGCKLPSNKGPFRASQIKDKAKRMPNELAQKVVELLS